MIRVAIAVGVRLYREGLALALAHEAELEVVGSASSRYEAIDLCARLLPDAILLDTAFQDAAEAVRALAAAAPATKVVAIAISETEPDVVGLAEAGVSGYATREASLDDLVAAVYAAVRGEVLCTPTMAAALLRRVTSLAARLPLEPLHELTPREREIVALLDRGLSNKQIADHLCIEVATVKNHVHNILEKLQVSRRSEAAAVARAHPPAVDRVT